MSNSQTSTQRPLTTPPLSFIIAMGTGDLLFKEQYLLAAFFFTIGLLITISAIRSKLTLSDFFDFKQHYIWLLFTLISLFYISFGETSVAILSLDFIMALGSLTIASIVYLINKN